MGGTHNAQYRQAYVYRLRQIPELYCHVLPFRRAYKTLADSVAMEMGLPGIYHQGKVLQLLQQDIQLNHL